jgi:adenylate cyclase
VSDTTQHPIAGLCDWDVRPALSVKGKTEPVVVYRPLGIRERTRLHEPPADLPLVGRTVELEAARAAIGRTVAGRSQILGLTAEAGMGKSRLGAAIMRIAREQGLAVFGGAAESHATSTSYLAWQAIWRGLLDIDHVPHDRRLEHLAAALRAIEPRLEQRLPLLGPLLALTIPDTPQTAPLDARQRTELLRSLLLQYVRARARVEPLMLVLEDCHWLDELSRDLLVFLARAVSDLPVLFLVLYRPLEGESAVLEQMLRLPQATILRLEAFTPDEARALINLKLEQHFGSASALPEVLLERITATAQGNPFYIEELINLARDRGMQLEDTSELSTLELPGSLHSLILSRIDQLAEAEQTTIKVASVIGRLFRASWIWGGYPAAGTPEDVTTYLERLSRLDLTPLDRTDPEREYLFKHITTQEVAYESLTYGLRATLHERIAAYVETHYAHEPEPYVDVLAFHYGRSRNTAKQRVYFRQAGDRARSAYANQAAIEWYQRLIPLLQPLEQAEVLRLLGEVQQLIGKWEEAKTAYEQALEIAESQGDRISTAAAQRQIGSLMIFAVSPQIALEWLHKARFNLEANSDDLLLSETLEYLTFAYKELGNHDQALEYARRHLELATRLGNSIRASQAHYQIGLVYAHQGELDKAQLELEEALDLAERISHQRGVVLAGNDLAGVLWQQGEYSAALQRLLATLTTAAEIGYLQQLGTLIGNAGLIYTMYGELERAQQCFVQGLQVALDLGDRGNCLFQAGNLAYVLANQGQTAVAERLFDIAIAQGRAQQIPWSLCSDLHYLARLLVEQDQIGRAVEHNNEALSLATQIQRSDIELRAQVLAVTLQYRTDVLNQQQATKAMRELLIRWKESDEQALIYFSLWRLDPTDEEARLTAARLYQEVYTATSQAECRDYVRELTGVTLPVPLPLPPIPERLLATPVDLPRLLQRIEVELGQVLDTAS